MVRFITDSRAPPTSHNVSLQVIGAGLPRTGTSSLQSALEQLTFNPCLHMAHIIPHASRSQLLLDAARETNPVRRRALIHNLVDGHAAICDLPAVFFLSDLMDMYPDAKIVLGCRTRPQEWAQSCLDCFGFFFSRRFLWTGLLWRTDRLWYRINMQVLAWTEQHFGSRDIFRPGMYELYNDFVKQLAKEKGREILEFKAEDGWDPLCQFLGKEVPTEEFPRVNERKTFAIIRMIMIVKGVVSWAALGGVAWLGWRYSPRLISAALNVGSRLKVLHSR